MAKTKHTKHPAVTLVPLRAIKMPPEIQLRAALNEDAVERYNVILDHLPPVILIDTPDGLLLADGFHRIEAARRLGRTKVAGLIYRGEWPDVLERSATANVAHGVPLTREERHAAVSRLNLLRDRYQRGQWTMERIAREVGYSQPNVLRIIAADEVWEAVCAAPGNQFIRAYKYAVPEGLLYEISKAPREQWPALARAAQDHGWSRDEMRQVMANLKQEQVSGTFKGTLLAGDAEPVLLDERGVPHALPETERRYRGEKRDELAGILASAVLPDAAQAEEVARAAKEHGWSPGEAARVATTLANPNVSEDSQEAMLRGETPPLTVGEDGKVRVSHDTLDRLVRQGKENSPLIGFTSMGTHIARTRARFSAEQIAASMSANETRLHAGLLRDYIAYLNEILSLMERPQLKVVQQ